jgi:hypothetical protein
MRSTRLPMQLPLATLTRVVGWLALLFGIVTILPTTIHLFIDQGGAFGLGSLLIPLIIPSVGRDWSVSTSSIMKLVTPTSVRER